MQPRHTHRSSQAEFNPARGAAPARSRGQRLARAAVAVALACGVWARAEVAPVVPPVLQLQSRLVITGLHTAYGIRQVGRFHSGGPFTSNPEFLLQTQAGRALDPERVLIALDHNLGAPLGNPAHAAGAVISIDPRAATQGRPLALPPDLALQPPVKGAPIQLYSAQAPRFLNRLHNEGSRTAAFTAVASPRYLSINNAFGRPWIANAPFGLAGPGSESVIDPDGAPLANAPSDDAGGVFAGTQTDRSSIPKAVRTGWFASLWNRRESGQLTLGAIDRGALGTALLGSSPDGSGFAVFAVVTGSGAVVQVHVQDGVDGLAPPGTIAVGERDPGLIGIAFKWNPERALFIADAQRDSIAVLHLTDDARQFKVERSTRIASPWLKHPVDLAAAIPEIANPRFASHTTLAGGSDLYVVNAGDGSVLRMRQDGRVLARAVIAWPEGGAVGPDRLRSIAVSADAQRLWLIAQRGDAGESVLIETNGFDAGGAFINTTTNATTIANASPSTNGSPAGHDPAAEGARAFATVLTPATGLGPLFNADSCLACHPGPGGASAREEHFARRIARMDPSSGRILTIDGQTSAIAPSRSTLEMGVHGAPSAVLPRSANVVSLRMPLTLFAAGRLDEIPDAVIEAQAVSKGDGIKGRANYVTAADGTRRIGRYGWKGDIATLDDMVAEALANEMGLASALAVHPRANVIDDGTLVRSLSGFIRTLGGAPAASPAAAKTVSASVPTEALR